MVQAWHFDGDETTPPQLPHRLPGSPDVPVEALQALGVLYWRLDGTEDDPELARIRTERGYKHVDIVDRQPPAPEEAAAFHASLAKFYVEHLHTDEEARYILGGGGYFDVRDMEDRWIRVAVEKGDFLILPPGIYHRFCLDEGLAARTLRLFVEEAVWIALNRPQDQHPVRRAYLDAHKGDVARSPHGRSPDAPDVPE